MPVKESIKLDEFIEEVKNYGCDFEGTVTYLTYKGKRLYLEYLPSNMLIHLLANKYSDTHNGCLGIEIPNGYNAENDYNGENKDLIVESLKYISNSTNVGWYFIDSGPKENQYYSNIFKEFCGINSQFWNVSVQHTHIIIDSEKSNLLFEEIVDYNDTAKEIADYIASYRERYLKLINVQEVYTREFKITTIYFDYDLSNINILKLNNALKDNGVNITVVYKSHKVADISDLDNESILENITNVYTHSAILFNLKDKNSIYLETVNKIKSFLVNYYSLGRNRIMSDIQTLYKLIVDGYITNDEPWEVNYLTREDGIEKLYANNLHNRTITLILSMTRLQDFCKEVSRLSGKNVKSDTIISDFHLYELLALINLTTPAKVMGIKDYITGNILNSSRLITQSEYIPVALKFDKSVKDAIANISDYRLVLGRTIQSDCLAVTKPLYSNKDGINAKYFPDISFLKFSDFISHITIVDNDFYNDVALNLSMKDPRPGVGIFDNTRNNITHYYFDIDTLPNYHFDVLDKNDFLSKDLVSFRYIDPIDLLLEGYGIIYNKYVSIVEDSYKNYIINGDPSNSPFRTLLIDTKKRVTKPTVNNLNAYLYSVNLLMIQIFTFYDSLLFLNDIVTFELDGERYIGIADNFPKFKIMPVELGNGVNYDDIDVDVVEDIKILPDLFEKVNDSVELSSDYKKTIIRVDKILRANKLTNHSCFQYATHKSKSPVSLYDRKLSEYVIAKNISSSKVNYVYNIESLNVDTLINNNPNLTIEEIFQNPCLANHIRINMSNLRVLHNKTDIIPKIFNSEGITSYSLRYVDRTLSPIDCYGNVSCKIYTTNYFKKKVGF